MSVPRFMLGLKSSGRKMCYRKLKTKCLSEDQYFNDATVEQVKEITNELRQELLSFIDSDSFNEYVVTTMSIARDKW